MTTDADTGQLIAQEDLVQAIRIDHEEVFTTMLKLEGDAGRGVRRKGRSGSESGVVSLIGLAGAWVGSGSLSCSASFAC